jgi:hypothetical protein
MQEGKIDIEFDTQIVSPIKHDTDTKIVIEHDMPTKHDSLLNIPTAKLNGELGQPQIKKSKTLLLKPPG